MFLKFWGDNVALLESITPSNFDGIKVQGPSWKKFPNLGTNVDKKMQVEKITKFKG